MHTSEWLLALQVQIAVAVCAIVLAHWWLNIPWRTTFLAAAFGNAIPIAQFPGFATWLYVQDFVLLILLAGLIVTLSIRWTRLGILTALTILIWPGLATLLTAFLGIPEGYAWITFLYRRFIMVILVIAIAGNSWRQVSASDFMDCWLLIWSGMCIASLFHFMGVVNLDFFRGLERGAASIEEGASALRGFLGLGRSGTGLLASATFAYCMSLVLFDPRLGGRRTFVCISAGLLSFVVVLFSGSRTGFIASMVALMYLGFRSLQILGSVRVGRVLLATAFAGMLFVGVVARGMNVLQERLQLREGIQSTGFQARIETQKSLVSLATRDAHVGLVGIGGGTTAHFRFLVGGLSHAHNDYLQFLWEGGWPGFALNLLWLFTLYHSMRPKRTGGIHILGIAGQAMFMAGLVMGLAEGHLASYSPARIAPSILVLMAYTFTIRDIYRLENAELALPDTGLLLGNGPVGLNPA